MVQKITISIPEPCHENWDKMSTSEKGKFCGSCQKNVVDFTKSSDRAIFLAYKEDENLCGRFKVSQLDREMIIPKEKKSLWMIAAATAFTFLGLGNHTAKAQGKPRIVQTDKKTIPPNAYEDKDNPEIQIEGKIFIDEKNPNFEDVAIFIDGKNPIFHPDSDGKFCITVNKNTSISIYKDGYVNYFSKIYNSGNLGAIELERENCKKEFVVGGAVAVKRSFWYRLFHKN